MDSRMEGNIKRKRDGNKARIGPEHQSNGGNDCGGIIMSALLANKKQNTTKQQTNIGNNINQC